MNQTDYLPPGVPPLTSSSTLSNYWFDTEKREQLLVRQFVRPGMTFFDVGAHIGRYTRLFSLAAGPAGRVFAFEPTPSSAAKLARAIREEKMDNVELIRGAVSDQSGTVILHLFPEEYSTWNGLGIPRMEDPKNPAKFVPIASEVSVPSIRLDEFCRSRGIDRIDYFKLDVEGVEYQALLGLEGMLKQQAIGALQFEVSKKMLQGLNTTAAPVFKLLESHGYHCHRIGEHGEVGPKVSGSDSFFENYVALPSRAPVSTSVPAPSLAIPASSVSPKFSFVTIVLNGMPFLEHALRAVYDFAHEIIVVEGAVKACSFAANPDGSSVDGTVECIRRFPDPLRKVRLIQGAWPEKCEMQNAALAHVTGDYVWLMDADEIYRREDLGKVADLVRREPSITQFNLIPDNFWKGFDHLMVSPFFFHPEAHYRRIFKFQPGAAFTTHRPPTLRWPGETRTTEQMECISGEITRAMGIIPFHYSYVLKSQVAQKIELYNRYGWGKGWQLDMNSWFRECWQAWTPQNRQAIEHRWPIWTGGRNSRTVPFSGEHPEVMREYIAAFRRDTSSQPKIPCQVSEAQLHQIIGSRNYLEKVLAAWEHIQLDAPLELRVRTIRAALQAGRPFWNNHVAFAFLADRLKPERFLEVGVRVGASMVQVLAHAPVKLAVGVDLWAGEYSGLPNSKEFAAAQLQRHRLATGGQYDLHLLQGNSHAVLKDLSRRRCSFNLINVDGDHGERGAMEDLEDALQLLAPQGAILFDDIIHPAHRYLLNVVQTFASRHPELTLLLNTKDDNGVAILLRGISLDELMPELGTPVEVALPNVPPTPPSAKNLKVAEDYAHEKDLTQIDGDSEFARAIRQLFRSCQPRRIIETGTYLGTGTTRVIAEAIRDVGASDAIFHSIEINPGHFARAKANLRAAGLESFVCLQRGLSVPRKLLPDVNQIEETTVRQPEYEGIFVDHREANRAKLYFAETNFSDCPDDLLGRVLAAFENRPDFVLLDSGGHMGSVEFQYLIGKLAGPCLIGLDDIYHIKHHKSFQFMRRDPRFELLVESKEKFGFCLARFTPAAMVVKPDNSIKRILWVRTDSIGDAVLASAMLEPIQKKYPQAKLAVLCQHRVASLYTACPFVDSIICYDLKKMLAGSERQQILEEISAFDPEVILNSVRSRDRLSDELTLAFAKARHIAIESDLDNVSAADRDAFRHRYEQIIPSPDAPRTELERHAGFLHGLGIEASNLKPVVWTSPADDALADAFFKQQELDPAQTIAVFPGAQYQMRVYHHYANALKNLAGFRFLIFGDATQNALAEDLERRLPGRTVSVCGRTTLGETVALLRRCRLYVGAESAGAHIACAVGVPNVVVLGGGHFGRFMPYSPLTAAVVLPLDCFGCNWRCPYEHTRCIANLAPDVVAAAIAAALQGRRLKPVIVAQTSSDASLPPALAARLAPGAVDFIAVAGQPISSLEASQTGGQIRSLEQLIHLLDQGSDETRKLSKQLRIIAWQYQGWENYQHERAGSAEAEAAVLITQLAPQFLPRLAPLNELDGRTALALGLAGELQKDWPSARACYSHALTRPSGGIFGFRLAIRLARMAALGGDPAMSDSLKTQIIPKLRAMLPAGLKPDVEEKAVLDWPVLPPAPAAPGSGAPSSVKAPAAPLVTAIVSAFKSERFIRGCLEDLEAQTIADRLEIVVVDSHSPQNERAIVEEFQKRYSNIVYIRTADRETVYGAWNRGVRAARGKYLTNANTDDRHRPDALEILARTLEENPDVSLAYADCLITPNENETYATAHPEGVYNWLEFSARDLWSQGCFAGPQPMWRREVHQEHGYFDAEMISAGDYEFWLRLAQNRKFLHVRATLGLYLKSPTSVEHANREVAAREVELARQRYRDSIMAGKPPFRPQLPEPTAKVEIMLGGDSPPPPAQAAAPRSLPAVARLGQLDEARELFARKDSAAAWAATLTAIGKRPFHPEAYLLLAEIALAAGAGKAAKQCAQRARDFAPGWSVVKQFLCRPLKGETKPDWLALPKAVGHHLSVCLIVKNEEKFLAQCLKSVRGFATQLIVVDTGSTDRTVEIAREFGAEIYFFAWCDDFAAARNAALEHATGDWVLMLDADEELLGAQHAKLLADMKNATTIAFRLPLVNAGQEIEGRSFVPRLFRNAPGASFTGRIHEQVFSSLLANAKKWGLKTALGSAELRHHGYTKDLVQDRNKVERNLKLLRAAIEENPADVNLQMNLGLELVRSDDLPAGVEKYRHAFELMSAQRPDERVPELREVLLTQFTSQLYKIRAHEEVVQVLHSRVAQHGGLTASLHFALGLAHFELKQFCEAADQMRQCLAKRKQPGLTPINTDILTAAPSHCLAMCLARLGDQPAAEKAFIAALTETGHVEAAKLDYAQFLLNGNRHLDALHQLNSLVAADPRHVAAWRLGGEIALGRPEFLEFALDWTAEACKALPENPVVAAQRAEALMLNRHAAEALPLWEKIWRSEHEPRTLAALILCEIAADKSAHAPDAGDDERATSLAFVEWYQKLIAARAKPLLEEINARLDPLSRTLPAAAEMLQAALAEAAAPLAAG